MTARQKIAARLWEARLALQDRAPRLGAMDEAMMRGGFVAVVALVCGLGALSIVASLALP